MLYRVSIIMAIKSVRLPVPSLLINGTNGTSRNARSSIRKQQGAALVETAPCC